MGEKGEKTRPEAVLACGGERMGVELEGLRMGKAFRGWEEMDAGGSAKGVEGLERWGRGKPAEGKPRQKRRPFLGAAASFAGAGQRQKSKNSPSRKAGVGSKSIGYRPVQGAMPQGAGLGQACFSRNCWGVYPVRFLNTRKNCRSEE